MHAYADFSKSDHHDYMCNLTEELQFRYEVSCVLHIMLLLPQAQCCQANISCDMLRYRRKFSTNGAVNTVLSQNSNTEDI